MNSLEHDFAEFRANTIGQEQTFRSRCGEQRIVYADNETNYCARCQTGGKLLADRALSRLLKASWPKRIDDLM